NALTVASNGVMTWTSGDLNGPLTVAAGGTLSISNASSLTMGYGNYSYGYSNTVALTNYGTVVWGGTYLYSYSSAVIYNAGLWQTLGDYTLGSQYGTNTFINTGTFNKT